MKVTHTLTPLTPFSSVTTSQALFYKGFSVTVGKSVTVASVTNFQSVTRKANNNGGCDGVTVETGKCGGCAWVW